MIDRFKALFEARGGAAAGSVAGAEHSPEQKRLAAAVLLVEAARQDGGIDESERAKVTELLQGRFALTPSEAQGLIETAAAAHDEANELVRFTRTVKRTFSADERVELIEMLWEVAYADGKLHPYEANLLRRVAGLIYVSDRERGLARKRVLARARAGDSLRPSLSPSG